MADPIVQPAKAPWHLWVLGVVSLLWNSVGALDFVLTETRNRAYMSGFTQAQLDFYYGFPAWVVTGWGIAVWGAVLGSLLLLFRRRQAVPLFLLSFVCLILTTLHNFVLVNGMAIMGGVGALVFCAGIIVIAVLLIVYSRAMCRRGVLR